MSTILVAIGGNALVMDNEDPSIAAQAHRAEIFASMIVDMVRAGHQPIITHGNGPQVGFIMQRAELASQARQDSGVPVLPLSLAVADSQGGIGHILSLAIHRQLAKAGLQHNVSAVITHCLVDPADPAFAHPDKPIGISMPADQASPSWSVIPTGDGMVRRVVASPTPIAVLESPVVSSLVRDGHIVIAGGGGGIPVINSEYGLEAVDAVIDKDRSSALLAHQAGIDTLVLVTGVPQVAIGWGTPDQQFIGRVHARQVQRWHEEGHFPPGSMGPKIEAALSFLNNGGREVIITDLTTAPLAISGHSGTHITKE